MQPAPTPSLAAAQGRESETSEGRRAPSPGIEKGKCYRYLHLALAGGVLEQRDGEHRIVSTLSSMCVRSNVFRCF
jgi:hypothetical protein